MSYNHNFALRFTTSESPKLTHYAHYITVLHYILPVMNPAICNNTCSPTASFPVFS